MTDETEQSRKPIAFFLAAMILVSPVVYVVYVLNTDDYEGLALQWFTRLTAFEFATLSMLGAIFLLAFVGRLFPRIGTPLERDIRGPLCTATLTVLFIVLLFFVVAGSKM